MKIMQINVWQGRILRPLLQLIEAESPDIIFTQEIFSYPETLPLSSLWSPFSTHELIRARGSFSHSYISPSNIYPMFDHHVTFGNAIFSKFPFSHSSTHYTGGQGLQHVDAPGVIDYNASRNFQHVAVNTGQTQLHLINHHGHWVNQPKGDDLSMARLSQVAQYIAQLSGPIIAGGDFNLLPNAPGVQNFLQISGLTNPYANSSAKSTLSPAHYISDIICDYLFFSPSIKVTNAEISDNVVSDHKALIAQFDC